MLPADAAHFPPSWFVLDAQARQKMAEAEMRLSRLPPMAMVLGSTPAGNYLGCYWQYGQCHPIPAQLLACAALDAITGTAEGRGFDDVGHFTTRGSYKGLRLALTKQYTPGTGNPRENLGHAVELRLSYCANLYAALPERAADLQRFGAPAAGFLGTWHVRMRGARGYKGDAEMCLWLPPTPVEIGAVPMGLPVAPVPPQTAPQMAPQMAPPPPQAVVAPQPQGVPVAQPVMPLAATQPVYDPQAEAAFPQATLGQGAEPAVPMGAPVEYDRKI